MVFQNYKSYSYIFKIYNLCTSLCSDASFAVVMHHMLVLPQGAQSFAPTVSGVCCSLPIGLAWHARVYALPLITFMLSVFGFGYLYRPWCPPLAHSFCGAFAILSIGIAAEDFVSDIVTKQISAISGMEPNRGYN